MLKNILLTMLVIAVISCSNEDRSATKENGNIAPAVKTDKQLNISILWDLSDRINPTTHPLVPDNASRDVAIIKYFADYLKEDMNRKGAFMAKGKVKVFFSPNPADGNINRLASQLDVDLSNKDVKQKKDLYDSISNVFEQTAKQIAEVTIKTSEWEGSDIYRFFKNDVKDYCISDDTSYRNILVILTDGYIYHPQSKQRAGNKSEYILPELLTSLGLRKNIDYKSVFSSKNCGLITTRTDLDNLEILVLEVNSEEHYKNDEDIIKLYFQKWFTDMNVKKFEIYNTDLPENTRKRLSDFLSSK